MTQHIFKELIKEAYPVVEISEHNCESPGRPLTYEEQNALRYVAGYIIRKVRQKLETSTHPEGMKDTAMKALLKSDDLLFEWCLIAIEADDDISTLVLEKIVEL